MVYFGNLGPFDDAIWGNGAPWWRNDKLGPIDYVMENSRSQWGPLDDAMINWDLLITWREIRGHHFDDIMRKFDRALDGTMENLGPLMTQWGNWKPLIRWWWTGGLNDLIWKREMGPWWRNGTFGALWWCNGQIRDSSNGKIGGPLMTWWGNWRP